MPVEPASLEALKALCLGFAFAGLLASGYQLVSGRPVSFKLLQSGDAAALASVPILVFSAPFVILRNTILARRLEGRPFPAVVASSATASLWSLLSGRLVLDAVSFLIGA